METYSLGALWNNPPVGLNRLEAEDSETSKAVFHFLRATWQDYPAKSFFPRTNSAAQCPQLLHCCSAGKGSPPHSSLAPPNSQWFSGFCFHRGGILTPKIIACGCAGRVSWKQKAHVAFRNHRKVWLGKELKIHLFPTPYHGESPLSQIAQILKRKTLSGHWEVLLFDVI